MNRPPTDRSDSRVDVRSVLVAIAATIATAFRPSPRATPPSTDPLPVRSLTADTEPPAEPEGRLKRLIWRVDRRQQRQPVLGFPLAVFKKFGEDQAGHLAALVSYYGFFSLFPLMLAFTSILGFVVDDPADQQKFADAAADQIPVVGDTIRNTAGTLNGSTIAVVVGVALAIWSGLKIIDAMQNALNSVWSVAPVDLPNVAKQRLRGVAMLAVIGGGLVASVVASGLASHLDAIPGLGKIGVWAATLLVSIGLYLVSFKLLTDVEVSWGQLLPGAVFGGISWWALQTFGTGFIANQQQRSGAAYGQFASIIALFAFLFLASQLSIVGAEINVVRARRLWPRSLTKGTLTAADVEVFQELAGATRQADTYEVVLQRSSTDV